MNLLEYEAKRLLEAFGVPVPRGKIITDAAADVALPCVIKSQVPVGGRGKAGGIKIVTNQTAFKKAAHDIFNLEIKGHAPSVLLAEEVLPIERELYLSISVNRERSSIELVAHAEGGIEVESHRSDEFYRRELTPSILTAVGQDLADYYDIPKQAFLLGDLLEKLYRAFTKSDALLCEINPLVLTSDGRLVAGDCKMTLDNAATFRHPDWNFETKPTSSNFVTLNTEGTIATIANGAGLAMATVDAVKNAGFVPANFLDIGGTATTESVLDSFNQLVKFNNLTNIIINIFGGIVHCDTVARAILEARASVPTLPPLLIRLSGTNADEARDLLEAEGIALYNTLEDCIKEIQP